MSTKLVRRAMNNPEFTGDQFSDYRDNGWAEEHITESWGYLNEE